jgi:NTP pyrophosphatase (non-canonical NTP hydrolase)
MDKSYIDLVNEEKAYTDGLSGCLDEVIKACHGVAAECGWWHDLETNLPKDRNHGELFMLMVSEISEAMEADRKDLMDDKLPHRKGVEVELADAIIRICDYAGYHKLDLGGALVEKLQFNSKRADHKFENRKKEGGKKY